MRLIPRLRRGATSVIAGSLLAATLVAAPTAAHAAPTAGCTYNPQYVFSSIYTTHINHTIQWGYAGETLFAGLESGDTVTGTIGGSLETDASFFFASAKVSVNASIARSFTSTITMAGYWTVPSTYKGEAWFAAGAEADHMNWNYGARNGACQWITMRTGTANLPYRFPVWYHS